MRSSARLLVNLNLYGDGGGGGSVGSSCVGISGNGNGRIGGVRCGRQKKRIRPTWDESHEDVYPIVTFIRSNKTSKSARRAALAAACMYADGELQDLTADGDTYAYAEDMWAKAEEHYRVLTPGDHALLAELMVENTSVLSQCRTSAEGGGALPVSVVVNLPAAGCFCVVPPPVPVERVHPACWGLHARTTAIAAVAVAAAVAPPSPSPAFARVHPAAFAATTLVSTDQQCADDAFGPQHAAVVDALVDLEASNVRRLECLTRYAASGAGLDMVRAKRRRFGDILASLIGNGEDAGGMSAAVAGGACPGEGEVGPCLQKHLRRGPFLAALATGDPVEVFVGYGRTVGEGSEGSEGNEGSKALEKWRAGVIAERRSAPDGVSPRSFRVQLLGSFEGDWLHVSAEEGLVAPPGTHLPAQVFRAHGVPVAVPVASQEAMMGVSVGAPADPVRAAADLLVATARRRRSAVGPVSPEDVFSVCTTAQPRGRGAGSPLFLFPTHENSLSSESTDGDSGGIRCCS